MTAMHLHVPDKLHVPMDKIHVPDKLHLDRLPMDRLPFVERRTSRLRQKRLLLAVPLLGALVAALSFWKRSRAQAKAQEYLESDVRQNVEDSLTRVGITTSDAKQHRTA